jgi:K+-sensing histidine kinase KdpD
MSPGDDTPCDQSHNSLDQLRHDLKTPLTTIHGRAQLLTRAVRGSPSLADEERTRMLEGLATIETEVRALAAMIDAMDGRA